MAEIQPKRAVEGISAVLLPFKAGEPDTDALGTLSIRTVEAGLTPAFNMDTGYTNLLTKEQRSELLSLCSFWAVGKGFVAGAFAEGESDPRAAYEEAIDEICRHGGTPILFPSTWLTSLDPSRKLHAISQFAGQAGRLLVFELGRMFVPFGEIWDDAFFEEVMQLPQVVGLKHSSLRRDTEWRRLDQRDRVRPDFKIYTGNDLAIDQIMWGSDYLLGLSAFYPEAFALRDDWWWAGDVRFYELNDALQFLGAYAFRPPVPAYKHSCAQFLKLRGILESDEPHPLGLRREASDLEVLEGILRRVEEAMAR